MTQQPMGRAMSWRRMILQRRRESMGRLPSPIYLLFFTTPSQTKSAEQHRFYLYSIDPNNVPSRWYYSKLSAFFYFQLQLTSDTIKDTTEFCIFPFPKERVIPKD
mmetsp:Transcript_19731/g.35556  ORF Transcript_19731/g.35556 Transcript_19731/m.35556 type:complete len:105 (+) Transcript_19731:1471-1785(+)